MSIYSKADTGLRVVPAFVFSNKINEKYSYLQIFCRKYNFYRQ